MAKTDGGLGRRHGQHEHGEDLADQVVEMDENATRLMFTANSINSTDIKMTMTFLRLMKIPTNPSVNKIAATVR